jgi:hypothetical protein
MNGSLPVFLLIFSLGIPQGNPEKGYCFSNLGNQSLLYYGIWDFATCFPGIPQENGGEKWGKRERKPVRENFIGLFCRCVVYYCSILRNFMPGFPAGRWSDTFGFQRL